MIIKPPINRHTLDTGWLMQPERLAYLCFKQANWTWGTYSGSKSSMINGTLLFLRLMFHRVV